MKAVIFLNPVGVKKQVLDEIKSRLTELEITPVMYENEKDIENSDFAIAFGGDGTILHAAKLCSTYRKSVLGINGGRLGYTAGLEEKELELLKNLKKGEYFVDKRMMLEVSVLSKTGEKLADADGSGDVNIKDATVIQKFIAGMDTGYHVGQSVS